MQIVHEKPFAEAEIIPINRIRVETALSRFPIHRLAKKDTVIIDLQRVGENGNPDLKWEVTYNQKHGQPGPLAYKVDTLIVNRRIDEAGRPLPEVIKLGSLTQLCSSLGICDSGENRANVKKALHQNASAYITAKIRIRTKTGKERWGEIGYTRYSVIFTGEVLPDGTAADAVYILPNPSHRQLLDDVEVRPLDYDYLTALSPGAQRFYELLSFQIYGAIAGGRSRAKMLYSEYCTHAPQSRYFDFDRVKKQMFKIHAPHRQAGYIATIEYRQTVDGEGSPDWEMLYAPGGKAVAEYEAFTRRQVRQATTAMLLPPQKEVEQITPSPQMPVESRFLAQMTCRGIAERTARELLAKVQPGQEWLDQLEYVDSLVAKDARGKLSNPPGLYITYVRDNVVPPAAFVGSRKRALIEKSKQQARADEGRSAQLRIDYEAFCIAQTKRYMVEELAADELAQMLETHLRQNRALFRSKPLEGLQALSQDTVRAEVRHSGRVRLPTFADFAQQAQPLTPSQSPA